MSNIRLKAPQTRVKVRIDEQGFSVTNTRGHTLKIAVSPSTEGFNPYELLSAAVGVCTGLGLRREATLAKVTDSIRHFELDVESFKAEDAPSRLERLELRVTVEGDVDQATKEGIANRAAQACTIANTLRNQTSVQELVA